jgi:hypothetical protein
MLSAVLQTIGSVITIGFGVWHIFVPAIWNWYSYFPIEARELIVAVRAINLFFSVSLIAFGVLMVVFTYRRPISSFYVRSIAVSLALLWGIRTFAQVIWPQGSITPVLQYGMLGIFTVTFLLFASSALLVKGQKD